MSSPPSLWNSFFVMLGLSLLSVIVWYLAVEMEQVNSIFATNGIYNVPESWQSANNVNWGMNFLYGFVYLLPILGIAHFITAVVRKQRYDAYQQQYYG